MWFIDVWIRVLPVHALEVSALDAVPKVAYDGVDEEEFTIFVPVRAPRVGGAVAVGLKDLQARMVSPDTTAENRPLVVGTAGDPHAAGLGNADSTIQPPVRPPFETVGDGVSLGSLRFKTIQ